MSRGDTPGEGHRQQRWAWLRMQMNYDLAKLREQSATIAVTRLRPDAA
jgi:hypothetical protein